MRRLLSGILFVCLTVGLSARAHADEAIDIVKKAIKAGGGKERLEKYNAVELIGTGTVLANGMELKYDGRWWIMDSGKFRLDLDTNIMGQKITIKTVFDGKTGWQKVADQETTKLAGSQLEAIRTQVQVDQAATLLPLLDTKKYSVSPVGEEKVEGKKAIGLNVTSKEGLDVNLYFDAKTMLLVKEQYQSKNETGKEVSQSVLLSGHKKVEGIPVPTKLEVRHDGKKYVTAEFSDVRLHEKLDAKTFKKP